MTALILPRTWHVPASRAPASALLPAVSPTLARSLLLALLLHVWLVLLLGNAPGGTARQGEGVWGAINVTLRGPRTTGAAEVEPPPLPAGPVGQATLPRWGGAVRDDDRPAPEMPGAAQVGAWAATAGPTATVAAPPVPAGQVVEDRSEAAPPQSEAVERRLSPLPAQRDTAARELHPLDTIPLARPVALPEPAPELAPALPPLPVPVAAAPLPTLSRLPPQRAQALPALGASPARLPVPELPALPSLAAPAMPVVAEPATQRLAMPPATAAASPVAPLAREPAAAPVPTLPPTLPALPALAASPHAPGPAVQPGTPDAGSRVGQDVATPAGAAASAPPRLNLQLARPRGGELSRWGSTAGALPVLPRPPELPDKFGRDVEKSAKPDCRSAYSGYGVLAPVPLVADALRKEGGCKW